MIYYARKSFDCPYCDSRNTKFLTIQTYPYMDRANCRTFGYMACWTCRTCLKLFHEVLE